MRLIDVVREWGKLFSAKMRGHYAGQQSNICLGSWIDPALENCRSTTCILKRILMNPLSTAGSNSISVYRLIVSPSFRNQVQVVRSGLKHARTEHNRLQPSFIPSLQQWPKIQYAQRLWQCRGPAGNEAR